MISLTCVFALAASVHSASFQGPTTVLATLAPDPNAYYYKAQTNTPVKITVSTNLFSGDSVSYVGPGTYHIDLNDATMYGPDCDSSSIDLWPQTKVTISSEIGRYPDTNSILVELVLGTARRNVLRPLSGRRYRMHARTISTILALNSVANSAESFANTLLSNSGTTLYEFDAKVQISIGTDMDTVSLTQSFYTMPKAYGVLDSDGSEEPAAYDFKVTHIPAGTLP